MESTHQELKHRGRGDDVSTAAAETERKTSNDQKMEENRRKAMVKRGLKSLAVAVVTPVVLTLIVAFVLFGSGMSGQLMGLRFVPPWALTAGTVGSAAAMALAAWLVWAEGGFQKRPEGLYFYLGHLGLGLAWEVAVFGAGAAWVGLVLVVGLAGAMVGCYRVYREVNPVAADLVKPCLAWAAFVAAVNVKLAMV